MDSYILGILWACATYESTEHIFLLRHRDPFYTRAVAQYFGTTAQPHVVQARTGDEHRLKLLERYCLPELLERGWEPRNADIRPYPGGQINHAGFCRAWIEIHSELGLHQLKGHQRLRLRIYGNRVLITGMNVVVATGAGVRQKTPQLVNEKTHALYYQSSREIEAILGWIYDGVELFNPGRKDDLYGHLRHLSSLQHCP